ncbi:MAG: ribokinase [Bacilli bacterium]|nr:ribokinase [Bacilli bacterium]
MKTILVVGSLNMDYTIYVNEFPKEGETLFGNNRFIQPGGKGANQAVAIAKSGLVNTVMIGAIGNDKDGEEVKNIVSSFGVDVKLIKKDVETGNATIVVDKNSENKIIIIGGANTSLSIDDIDVSLIEKADYIVLQNEINQAVNDFVINKAYELNKIIIYNPAPYRNIDDDILEKITYFIPNEIELEKYSNMNNIDDGISYLLNKGIKNVLVTLGTKGSLLKNKNESIKVDAFKVEAIDTVAAGDTFVGYFVSALASGKSEKEAMLLASKASSITVSRKGSLVSIPTLKEIYEKYSD